MSKKIVGITVGTPMNPQVFVGATQADMAQNDSTKPGYVKNRTHWEENNPAVVSWDGDTVGRRTYTNKLNETYYQISDVCPGEDDILGATIVYSNGNTTTVTSKTFTGFVDGVAAIGGFLYAIQRPTISAGNVIDFGAVGLYAKISGETYPAMFTYGEATVHTLDEKFIPETIARKEDIRYAVEHCGGLNETARNLLITILSAGTYDPDQTENIAALEVALKMSGGGSDEPDVPDEPEAVIYQTGSILTIISGVTVSQSDSLLSIR